MPYPRHLLWDILPQNTPNSQNLLLRCPPTDFSLGGYGILPYPRHLLWDILPQNTPNSQNLLLRCPPTDFTDLHRYLGCAVLPQNLAAWVWQGCHTLLHLCASVPSVGGSSLPEVSVRSVEISFLPRISQIYTDTYGALFSHGIHRIHRICQRGYGRDAIPSYICEHPCHLWEALLCKRFCVFGVFRGSFFTACSVGAAETAAPPGGIHGSSVHISPPHHLTTTTSFHLEPCLLHVLPVLWVRLRHHLRLVDAQPGEHDCRRCERHRHAVVVVGVDRL